MTVARIAERNEVDQNIVRREMHKGLSKHVIKNYALAKDFRVAMTQLCLAQLDDDALGQQSCASILEWLQGRPAAHQRREAHADLPEDRASQRESHACLDCAMDSPDRRRRAWSSTSISVLLPPTHRRDVPEDEIYYTPAALWDAYEVLRQFIDATDEMEGLLVVVSAPDSLLDDFSNRSLQKYRALRNRIWDDVRDRRHVNPYAPMVRIASAARERGMNGQVSARRAIEALRAGVPNPRCRQGAGVFCSGGAGRLRRPACGAPWQHCRRESAPRHARRGGLRRGQVPCSRVSEPQGQAGELRREQGRNIEGDAALRPAQGLSCGGREPRVRERRR